MLTYKQSGVDIDEGNRAVNLIKGKIKSTYDNNVIGDLGTFSGLYSLKEFVHHGRTCFTFLLLMELVQN